MSRVLALGLLVALCALAVWAWLFSPPVADVHTNPVDLAASGATTPPPALPAPVRERLRTVPAPETANDDPATVDAGSQPAAAAVPMLRGVLRVNGSPVDGWRVTVRGIASVPTADDGGFEVPIPHDEVQLLASPPRRMAHSASRHVTPHDARRGLLVWDVVTAALEVQVVDRGGPVPSGTVELESAEEPLGVLRRLLRDGRAVFEDVGAGRYDVVYPNRRRRNVLVPADGLVVIDVTDRFVVRGSVSVPAELTLEGACLQATAGDDGVMALLSRRTGAFEISGLVPGRWTFRLRREHGPLLAPIEVDLAARRDDLLLAFAVGYEPESDPWLPDCTPDWVDPDEIVELTLVEVEDGGGEVLEIEPVERDGDG